MTLIIPQPICRGSCFLICVAVFSKDLRIERGVKSTLLAFIADNRRAVHPTAFGQAMEVPFMYWFRTNVDCGTEVIAAPGAAISTPRSPFQQGPRELQVKGNVLLMRSVFASVSMISGVIRAPIDIIAVLVPPGAPMLPRLGPLFPALDMNRTPFSLVCLCKRVHDF